MSCDPQNHIQFRIEQAIKVLISFAAAGGSGSETAKETSTFLWPFQAPVKVGCFTCNVLYHISWRTAGLLRELQ